MAISPYNEALIHAILDSGIEQVDVFAPDGASDVAYYGERVRAREISYGKRALPSTLADMSWRRYSLFSGTSETPLGLVGVLSQVWRKPSIALVDEIRSGGYRGNDPEAWKRLCRFAIRRANLVIVNDKARIDLLTDYAGGPSNERIFILPAAYRSTVRAHFPKKSRANFGIPDNAFVVAFSGGFSTHSGADWFLQALDACDDIWGLLTPLQIDAMHLQLLAKARFRERLVVQSERVSWFEAWAMAGIADLGVAIYNGPQEQASNTGLSSNRLCQFIAMGVPVIASDQPSFAFLRQYDCGVLVNDCDSFVKAVSACQGRIQEMKAETKPCLEKYIAPDERYDELHARIRQLL